jgi:uncharacterized ion transporter superfamily protein YfcC
MFCWLLINLTGFIFILRYAKTVKRNPQRSPVQDEDVYWKDKLEVSEEEIARHTPLAAWIVFSLIFLIMGVFAWMNPVTFIAVGEKTLRVPALPVLTILFGTTGWVPLKKSVLFFIIHILLFTILILITGVMGYQWYIAEIATLFFAMGLAAGISMNYSANKITKLFLDGVRDIQSAALIVGLAGGIIIILNNGNIIDTLLYRLSQSISGMGKMASLSMMYVVQTIINLAMPSGSAKAALTMPMMSQFSDLIGVSRQATVMAYQLGDGFTNMITPTSGVLLGVLSVARIPYHKWFRWILPLIIILVILGFFLLVPTVYLDLKGF